MSLFLALQTEDTACGHVDLNGDKKFEAPLPLKQPTIVTILWLGLLFRCLKVGKPT
jgi:hypothetical protein